jgi:hypothetical protein
VLKAQIGSSSTTRINISVLRLHLPAIERRMLANRSCMAGHAHATFVRESST